MLTLVTAAINSQRENGFPHVKRTEHKNTRAVEKQTSWWSKKKDKCNASTHETVHNHDQKYNLTQKTQT